MTDFATLDETTQLGVDRIASSPTALALYRNLLAAMEGKPLGSLGYGAGLVKLASGSVSAAAALEIVMTAYTAYRNKLLILTSFLPATDMTLLSGRVSTDGGSSFDSGAGAYRYARRSQNSSGVTSDAGGTDSAIVISTIVGNASGEGCSAKVWMFDTTTVKYGQFLTESVGNNGTPATLYQSHGVERLAFQDTDAFRVEFSSGNITSGEWMLYGFN